MILTDAKELTSKVRAKDLRSLSRLISAAENQETIVYEVLKNLYQDVGKSKIIGFTGPPGAGKSSLVGQYIKRLRKKGKTVAVVAVDPVSPFTGGALLGDRIRLTEHFNDPGVFIRSLSTRGKLGGLSLASRQVVHLLDAFGFDYVLVETVGVGQSEIDIRKLSDLTLLALVPESGDGIQTLKAGILEIADIFVVNKADREGADRLILDLKSMAQISGKTEEWIFSTSISNEESLHALFEGVEKFFTKESARIEERRKGRATATVEEILSSFVLLEIEAWMRKNSSQVKNPYDFALEFRSKNPPGALLK